jgi:excisionase family DNA binding protein
MKERLLDAGEVAELLACSKQKIYLLAEAGELPSFKIGSLRRFSPADVQTWLEQQREGEPSVA